jgi:1,4-dihydroxy-2-naphthoate octaprenyltransferase
MAALYPWFVFAHLVGMVLFAISHGASAYVAFRVRSDRDPRAVASLLAMSELAKGPMYIGLVLLLIGGAGAATAAGLWLEPWIIASIVVLVVVLGVMYSVATPYYGQLRTAVGDPSANVPATVSPEQLGSILESRRPEALLAVGTGGLLILVWLMVLKPG